MENVTDRTSNPFGMEPPCEQPCGPGVAAVHGYGDANADFHVVGDHPGVHGGRSTGVPFTETVAGERLQAVLYDVGLLADPYSDQPAVRNLFCSYLHSCCPPDGRDPTDADYLELERFFDAELRAITAHVLVPVGERAIEHVLQTYTSRARLLDRGVEWLHAREIHGAGFLVVPVREPADWEAGDRQALVDQLRDVLDSDYRQISDLGRFTGIEGDSYLVR